MKMLTVVSYVFLSLGAISLACTSGETVSGDPGTGNVTGTANTSGGANTSGAAGTTGSGNTTGAAGTTGSGNTTGRAGTTGTGNVTGTAGTTGSGNTTGTGNTSGAAGTTGSGNTSGGGNTSGTAGTTGGGTCVSGTSNPPNGMLITDFSDAAADAGEVKFGTMAGIAGGTSRFSSGTKGTLTVTAAGALTFSGMVDAPSTANMYPYNGFAVYMNGPACINAGALTGVSFTISALTGTCPVVFGFGDADHTSASSDSARGTCTGTCYGAAWPVTSSTTKIAFADAPGSTGMPATPVVNAAKLTGVQWQFQNMSTATTACTGSITVDNIKFY